MCSHSLLCALQPISHNEIDHDTSVQAGFWLMSHCDREQCDPETQTLPQVDNSFDYKRSKYTKQHNVTFVLFMSLDAKAV